MGGEGRGKGAIYCLEKGSSSDGDGGVSEWSVDRGSHWLELDVDIFLAPVMA